MSHYYTVNIPGKSTSPSIVIWNSQTKHNALNLRIYITTYFTGGQIPGYEPVRVDHPYELKFKTTLQCYLVDTDTMYLLSVVRAQPKMANWWPSKEYFRGPPGLGKQCLIGSKQLCFKPFSSHCRRSCLERLWSSFGPYLQYSDIHLMCSCRWM